jgi:LacI family transcriptional regulator
MSKSDRLPINKPVQIVDMARMLNVSHSTVSRALDPEKQNLISEEVRKKVVDLADRLNYRPQWMRKARVSRHSRTIGLIIPAILDSIFFQELIVKSLMGVHDVLESFPRYTCRIHILPVRTPMTWPDSRVFEEGLDGFLISGLCGPYIKDFAPFPERVRACWNKPVVFLNLEFQLGKGVNLVGFDNQQAAYLGTTHLIERGHRAIAYLDGGGHFEESMRRKNGYLSALNEHLIPVKKELIQDSFPDEKGGFQAVSRLFQKVRTPPTAIFAWDDETAIGAIRALETLGKRCPGDVAVLGFDGLRIGEYVRPRLTTVAQPLREMAREGTGMLIDLIEKKIKGPVLKLVPGTLIVREST